MSNFSDWLDSATNMHPQHKQELLGHIANGSVPVGYAAEMLSKLKPEAYGMPPANGYPQALANALDTLSAQQPGSGYDSAWQALQMSVYQQTIRNQGQQGWGADQQQHSTGHVTDVFQQGNYTPPESERAPQDQELDDWIGRLGIKDNKSGRGGRGGRGNDE